MSDQKIWWQARKIRWSKVVWHESRRTKTARLHRNRHNYFHRRNLDERKFPLERILPGLHFELKHLLNPSPGGGDMVGWSLVGPNLRGFTKTGITFCTGGILMLGLWHWKANFKGLMEDQILVLNLLIPGRPTMPSGQPTTLNLFNWSASFVSVSVFQLCQLFAICCIT